ncbi:hypothetical protein [Nitrososphaera sp. AFS]|uniref:hypothetical protein n=1 Tax=Nitrososphaera sp. AFS TaxID=2301191 RepID=UPI0013924782|nr:hypothetical protein [Nitrososphaera sp. AFS]NAL77388.1 hypothetical protein [Nitrososphaera sp. AFS]
MTVANNFALQQNKAQLAAEWINSYAIKNNRNLELELEGYFLHTTNFGDFEVVSWKGDWAAARKMMIVASRKLNIKVVDSGYHAKGHLLSSLLGISREFAKVYSGGSIIGHLELTTKSGKWVVKGEKLL